MYDKIRNLNSIVAMGLNVHQFIIPDTISILLDVGRMFQKCTIRTDHEIKTNDLPFYIFDLEKDEDSKLYDIWNESQEKGYKLIISNGIQYDPIQIYNMVVRLHANGDFIFEASELKIPLRHMYRYPLLSCSGNLGDEVSEWEVYNARYGIDKIGIRRDLLDLYDYQIFERWLEITKYPIPIGKENKNIVFWQII